MPQDVKLVIGAGAGGGLVSWAFTIMTGATFGLGVWGALPLCVILGTAAALIAVYVVTPTDTGKTGKLIGFAVLCGFLWKPVLDAGRLLVNQRIDVAKTSSQLDSEVRQLRETRSPEAVGASAHEAGNHAAELLSSSARLDNPKLQDEAAAKAEETVEVIAATATANPAAATLALEEIRIAAHAADKPEVARAATEKIDFIARSAPPELLRPPLREFREARPPSP